MLWKLINQEEKVVTFRGEPHEDLWISTIDGRSRRLDDRMSDILTEQFIAGSRLIDIDGDDAELLWATAVIDHSLDRVTFYYYDFGAEDGTEEWEWAQGMLAEAEAERTDFRSAGLSKYLK